jgi:acid phosphatase (class A)
MKKYLIFLTVLFLSACATQKVQIHAYRAIDEIQVEQILAQPPKIDSKAQRKDIAEVLRQQSIRTSTTCEESKKYEKVDFKTLFSDTLDEKEFKKWNPYFAELNEQARSVMHKAKHLFKRERPYVVEQRVVPCFEMPKNSYSYPSGHSFTAHFDSLILDYIFHDQKFKTRAEEIAMSRVKAGVHFPSDIEAGKKLAEIVFKKLKEDHDFKSDINSRIKLGPQ